jgi:hypothetical protein
MDEERPEDGTGTARQRDEQRDAESGGGAQEPAIFRPSA